MDAKKFLTEYKRVRNPVEAFFAALSDGDMQKLETTANRLQDQYVDALQHAATVGLIEGIAKSSPYAAVAMLESMTLADPTKKAAYMAVANRAENPIRRYGESNGEGKSHEVVEEFKSNSRVNALLRDYCLQQAGFPKEEYVEPKKVEA